MGSRPEQCSDERQDARIAVSKSDDLHDDLGKGSGRRDEGWPPRAHDGAFEAVFHDTSLVTECCRLFACENE